jgi:hypothetical protein
MRREYGPYEQQSKFFVSIDREKKTPTGTLRIIKNGPAGLKTLNDLTELKSNPHFIEDIEGHHKIESLDDCWDVGTVAVPRQYRSAEGGVSVQLYRGMYVAAKNADVQHLVSIIDDRSLSKLTGYLGIPFKPLAEDEPFEYLGSKKSHAVYGYLPEFYGKMNRKRWTLRGVLARKVLSRLVGGSQDSELQF